MVQRSVSADTAVGAVNFRREGASAVNPGVRDLGRAARQHQHHVAAVLSAIAGEGATKHGQVAGFVHTNAGGASAAVLPVHGGE